MTDDASTRSTPSRSGLRAIWIAYFAVATLWAVQVIRHLALDLRFEDALIVLRYARHLVEGHGFVFNIGEQVLGVTTPLHTVMSTLWVVLGGEAAPGWQNAAGVVWLAIQGAFAMAWLQRLGRPWLMLPVGWLILGNYNLVYLYFGMETHAFAALALCALWLAADRTAADQTAADRIARPIALGLVLGAAFLLRYDAALLALLIGLDAWWRDRRLPIRMTVAFFAVVTPWLVFAQLTFGSILPQPLDAKEGFVSLVDYLRDVHAYYRDTWTWILGAIVPWDRGIGFSARLFPAVVALGVVGAVLRDRRALIAALYPALHVLVYASLGSDPGFRWHVYLLNPFGFLFFALGVEEGIRFATRWAPERWAVARDRRLAVVAVVLVALPLVRHLGEQMRFRYQPDPLTVQLTTMGTWLRDHYPPETTVLHPAIGILGWESGLRIVDHAGLVTPGLFFYNDLDATPLDAVVDEHQPDLILLSQWSPEDPTPLGYAPVHVFEQPFVYTLWGRDVGAGGVAERAEAESSEGG